MKRIDLPILLSSLLLVLISLATFYSLDISIFKQQLFALFISFFFFFIFLNIDHKILGLYSNYIYFIMLFFLLVLFLIGIEARGAVRWIDIFGIRVQVSEIFKPFFVIYFAHFLTSTDSKSLKKFLKAFLLLFPIFFLTLKQPDLGNAMIYFFTLLFILFMYGFPKIYFFISGIIALLPMPILYGLLHDYQKKRIINFIDVSNDPLGSSYNSIQSMISVGSGGFTGKGLGQATQSILKFLPERHTDFIFASLSESLGFMGGGLLLFVFFYLLYRIYKISANADNEFSYLILSGFFFLFLTHIFFNIGMNIGIFPIVGITLPFVSYGGSSLLSNFIILGIISSISFEAKRRHSFEIK